MNVTAGDDSLRVINIVTELSDGTFVWSSTAEQRCDIPPHLQIAYVAPETAVDALMVAHKDQLASSLRTRTGVTITPLASLQDVFDSENRCQSLTAAFVGGSRLQVFRSSFASASSRTSQGWCTPRSKAWCRLPPGTVIQRAAKGV